ncbi:OLC1v1032693C1 [Oldenlandia corymbosa var. corymbosa]|uniref:OLC1v1032693C1 n=1 Tax=Oldenlandia corymbosa var. corymbosa TaxID=529605 RepID=A0AAV1CLN9_OLDCO|nr:OLC1v1032693C1 [Oldenlandia corymbosa var. corymbosa]
MNGKPPKLYSYIAKIVNGPQPAAPPRINRFRHPVDTNTKIPSGNCQQHELNEGRRTKIAEALQWLRESLSSYRKEGLEIGMIIAVWDDQDETERGLYRMNGKGEEVKELLVATGSGSVTAISAFISEKMPYSHRMITIDEAADLAKKITLHGFL